jgi:hypothetical protein
MEIQLSIPAARWFKVSAAIAPVALLTSLTVGLIELGHRLDGDQRWDARGIWMLASCAAVAGLSGFVSVLGLGVLFLRGRATFDGSTLTLMDQVDHFRFPRQAVRSIAVALRKPGAIDIDLTRPPHRIFARADAVALDVEVPEGRIRFFKPWGKNELCRVAAALGQALEATVEQPEPVASPDRPVADATGIYGKSRQGLVYFVLSLAVLVVIGFGWVIMPGLRSLNWQKTTGTVNHSLYERRYENGSTKYVAEIRYEYRAGGRSFTSDRIGYGRAPGDAPVKALVRNHPIGSTVDVFYNARSPVQSVLLPGTAWFLWIPIGAAVIMIGLVVPWWIKGPGYDLDKILRAYKVEMPSATMDAGTDLVRWTTPQGLFDAWSRRDGRRLCWMALRIAIVSGLSLWGLCVVLRRINSDLPTRSVVVLFGSQLALMCGSLLCTGLRKGKPGEYQLTSDGLVIIGRRRPLLQWERFTGYRVKSDNDLPSHGVLLLFQKGAGPRHVALPGDERDRLIMCEVRKRLRYQP